MLYTYIIYVYLLCVWHIVSLVCSSIIWSRCFQSLGIFLYASVIFCVRVLFLSFFSSSSSFVVDFVWLYFLRWFDWCRCWCCRYWYRALKFTCIENHSRYIIQRERKKTKKKTAKAKISTLHTERIRCIHAFIYIYFLFVIFYFIYKRFAMYIAKSTSKQLVKCMTVYIRGNGFHVWIRALTLYVYTSIPFIFMTRERATPNARPKL